MNKINSTHSSFFPAETGEAKALICAAQMLTGLQVQEENRYVQSITNNMTKGGEKNVKRR